MRRIAFWLTLITIFLMPWEGILVLPGVGTVSRLMGMITAAFWLITVLFTGKFRKPIPFHLVVLLFFLWNATTMLWSFDPEETWKRSMTYLQLAIFVLLLWDLFSTKTDVRMGLQAYLLGAYIPAVSTILNYLNGIAFSYGRYASTGDNPNTTGILIGLGLPLAWYLAVSTSREGPSRIVRLLNYIYIPVAIFAILLTATRFALLMALPAMVFGLSSLSRISPQLRALLFVLMLGALSLLSSWVPETAFDRFATIGDELQTGDLSDRTVLWNIGIDLWLDNPLGGVGSAAYNAAVAPIFGRPRSIHNTFVAVLVELGIIGVLLFSVLILTAFLYAWCHSSWELRFWLTTLTVWLMGNLVLTWIYYKPTWLVLGLLAVSATLEEQKRTTRDWVDADPLPITPGMTDPRVIAQEAIPLGAITPGANGTLPTTVR